MIHDVSHHLSMIDKLKPNPTPFHCLTYRSKFLFIYLFKLFKLFLFYNYNFFILISFYKIKLLLFYDLKSLGNFSPPQKQIHFFPNSSFEKKINIRKNSNNNNNNNKFLYICAFFGGIVAILIFTLNFHFCHDTIINVDT